MRETETEKEMPFINFETSEQALGPLGPDDLM